MKEKERLKELLVKALFSNENFGAKNVRNEVCIKFDIDKIADYLLDNGVIVPPCKLGDTVWVIEPCTCHHSSYAEACKNRRTYLNARKYLDIVEVPTKGKYIKCLKLFGRKFRIEYLSKIGKTVFLTREEAERALKEVDV